jgi:hypothetical protein
METLSSLAYKYNNLLGRKWVSSNTIADGYVTLKTKEFINVSSGNRSPMSTNRISVKERIQLYVFGSSKNEEVDNSNIIENERTIIFIININICIVRKSIDISINSS